MRCWRVLGACRPTEGERRERMVMAERKLGELERVLDQAREAKVTNNVCEN